MSKFFCKIRGDLLIASQVTSEHLDVVGTGQPKVNGLAHDVCREEIKRYAGKVAIQGKPQISDVVSRRPMTGVQGDHNVCVRRSGGATVIIAQVDAGNGNAEVVDNSLKFLGRNFTANALFDAIDQHRSFLEASAGMGTHVQAKRARIHAGKKVLAKERNQQPRAKAEGEKEGGELQAMVEYCTQQLLITLPKPIEHPCKAALEHYQRANPGRDLGRMCALLVIYIPFEPHHQSWHESSG